MASLPLGSATVPAGSSPAGSLPAVNVADWGHAIEASGSDGEQPQDETPERSPLRQGAIRDQAFLDPFQGQLLAGGSDPLGEGLGLLAGMAIGLLTLLVPLLSVVSDRSPGPGFSIDNNPGIGRPR